MPASKIRLHVKQPFTQGGNISVSEKQAHYIANVMRLKTGDKVIVFNGMDGEWLTEIASVSRKDVVLSLQQQLRAQKPSPDVWLLAAPLRNNKSELVMEKATELGISRFVPVHTQFAVATRINHDRFSAIAVEASEQCERLDVPEIEPIVTLPALIAKWNPERKIIYGDESGAGISAGELLEELGNGSYAVLIGPEGGFSQDEFALLRGLDYTSGVSLGPRILRADTAAIAALTLVQSRIGDWKDKPAFRATQD